MNKEITLSFIVYQLLFILSLICFLSCSHIKKVDQTDQKSTSNKQIKKTNKKAHITSVSSLKQTKKTLSQKSIFYKAVLFFQQGQLDLAISEFESINYGHPDFTTSLLEIQKINYIKKNWNKFFGLASYYRNVLLSSLEKSKEHFKQEMLALEILALIRHCRFSDTKKLADWSLHLASQIKQDGSKIKKTVYFLNFKEIITENKKAEKSLKNYINFWPLNIKQINLLDNPKYLRVKVESQC